MKGRVSFCNAFLLKITGYSLEEVLGHNWFDEFVPDTRPDVKEEFLRGLQTGGIVSHHENTVLTKMGRELFINFSNTILRDEQGNISGITSIGEDITEQRKLQEALIQNENLLSESQRVAHIGSWKNELKGKSIWSEKHSGSLAFHLKPSILRMKTSTTSYILMTGMAFMIGLKHVYPAKVPVSLTAGSFCLAVQ